VHEALRAERARLRQLCERQETQRWVHHVADLASGEVLTTPLDRPVTPLSRAERLSQLGHPIDPAIFGWPSQRFTPKQPYQPAPEAWLVSATGCSYYSPRYDIIQWEPPRECEEPVQLPPRFYLYCIFTAARSGARWRASRWKDKPSHRPGGSSTSRYLGRTA
jgi:hypothetical protein